MNYLVVAAHPDDEVLGAGATIYQLTKAGHSVEVCILSGKAEARANRPSDEELSSDISQSLGVIGAKHTFIGDFPNIKLNTVDHLSLVQFIEKAILAFQPDVVITHHPSDSNNDHLHTSLACQEAIRIFQRRDDVPHISELWFMEVPSATDWGVNPAMHKFDPDLFVEVGREGLDKKLEALSAYVGVQRPYPHPRSTESIEGLAYYRGSQAGCRCAESFQVAFRRITF